MGNRPFGSAHAPLHRCWFSIAQVILIFLTNVKEAASVLHGCCHLGIVQAKLDQKRRTAKDVMKHLGHARVSPKLGTLN